MKHIKRLMRTSSLTSALVVAGLTLAACNPAGPPANVQQAPPPTAALALTDASAPPLVDAPPVSALPPAPRARIGRLQRPSDGYAFADSGYAMSHAFADAPPDYTFDYGGVRPWVWRADDQSEQVVEPIDGGDRYYYYRPGDDQPFLIRDPDYSYGYEGGELVVIYDRNGNPLPDQYVEQRADMAGRYLARALAIYAAAQSQQHQAVAAANWRARRAYLDSEQNQWTTEQSQDDGWRAYHAEHDQDEQAQWDAERYRRQAEAARYATQANDIQAAARFAQAAALALQLSQSHRQGPPPNAPQGGPSSAGFGPRPQGPAQQFGPGQGQARTGGLAPSPANPAQPPVERGAGDRAAQQAAAQQQARAQAQQQAEAQQQGRAQAQQQAAQHQHSLDAAAQARVAQQAAAQQQARTQMEQRSAQQQQALDAQARARVTQQAAAQQQARAQMQQQAARQQAAQRQQALGAARAQAAQQAAAQQQARARAEQGVAQRQAHAQQQAQQRAEPQKAPPAAKPKPAAASDKPGRPDDPKHPHQKQPE